MSASPQVESPTYSSLLFLGDRSDMLPRSQSAPQSGSGSRELFSDSSGSCEFSACLRGSTPNQSDKEWADQKVIGMLKTMPWEYAFMYIFTGDAKEYAHKIATQQATRRWKERNSNPTGATPPIPCSTNLPKRTQSN